MNKDDFPEGAIEDYMQFRKWYSNDNKELLQWRREKAEIGFLKLLTIYWRAYDKEEKSQSWSEADVEDWWWYANSYIWNNFPPLYWGYADLLNRAQIKYIP